MLDPIGGFGRIKDFFISYVETSFRIADTEVAAARRQLLISDGVLTTEPFLEPVLRYETSEKTLEELASNANLSATPDGPLAPLSIEGRRAFVEIALSGLFEGKPAEGEIRRASAYLPYQHQIAMLARGLRPGKSGIVTSGTGSGKTESFMLPVLAAIANEAVHWPKPKGQYLQDMWWRGDGDWKAIRSEEQRPAAVRALVLYPMNALVEDQMVRLRRTLDSEEVREVMDERLGGNRIFFGQYTSSTPVTGHERHPRLADDQEEKGRRKRRLADLRAALRGAEDDQRAAREFDALELAKAAEPGAALPELTRYIFPSTDGAEMLSRWDIQVTPPDVLVTNASMLGAMLSREIEAPIFDTTREWLTTDDNAYFYLIVDELHLLRGSAGTEVAFLIKTLIERLGLSSPQHRHKLRILASSASLPMDGEDGERSRAYLRDLFAPYGTSSGPGDSGTTDTAFWTDCVIKGVPNIPLWERGKVDPNPFSALLQAALGTRSDFVARISRSESLSAALRVSAAALGASGATEDEMVKAMAEAAAAALTYACRDGDGVRATGVAEVSERLFTSEPSNPELALRGLMLARALPESGLWDARVAENTPAFRLHTFIRNIEGLFAAPQPTEDGASFHDLTVDRGLSHAPAVSGKRRGDRLFELLYCEACGELLIGGQRGQETSVGISTELLPSSGNIENLPEAAANEYYDNMTLEEFAVFWPRPRRREPMLPDYDYDQWDPAHLDLSSGVVTCSDAIPDGHIGGYLYFQKANAGGGKGKRGKEKSVKPPSAQPFCCPNCGTDYSRRPVTNRSRSPIRAFRTGVSKSSQLVATELFELLHATGAEPKGICFSDSRQDAANQALEIESMHLRDLRREVLVWAARERVAEQRDAWMSKEAFKIELDRVIADGLDSTMISKLIERYDAAGKGEPLPAGGRKVALNVLLQYEGKDGRVGELVGELVRAGIHPFDSRGRARFRGKEWYELFDRSGKAVRYADSLSGADRALLSYEILKQQYELIDDVIFANTFFALEETGLGYPCFAHYDRPDENELDAWLRVFAGSYRIKDNKYVDPEEMKEWVEGSNIPATSRVRKLANKLYGESGALAGLTDVISRFAAEGHRSGMFDIGNLYLKIAEAGDPYWRCSICERVHLHRGFGSCTRCGEPLSTSSSGAVEELWSDNFLARRIVRSAVDGVARFRLRVEELTGQTDNFSERLRKFKGIFVNNEGETERLAKQIDMLSVTTTMEVGIDIGALQSVYQANMPPQRFNYQQRVGRAGRRRQAFSLVVTFCRGRTHDAYYFAHPKAITGDAPPPPFLAVGHDSIPLRLLRKSWLRAAFQKLRDECRVRGETYPGDRLTPPDVHGEYVTTEDYYGARSAWPMRLKQALEETVDARDAFLQCAVGHEQQHRLLRVASVEQLMQEIDELKEHAPSAIVGMARFLAEWGLLPMYGMPTSVRPLYVELRNEKGKYAWSSMSRDLDMAVLEYAPGSVLVKDKERHKVIGFTGSLTEPRQSRGGLQIKAMSNWWEAQSYIATCEFCGSIRCSESQPMNDLLCDDCQQPISTDSFERYLTPTAFRTDFIPKTEVEDSPRTMQRMVATMLNEGEAVDHLNMIVRRGAGATIMQLNDGVADHEGKGQRFQIDEVRDRFVPVRDEGKRLSLETFQAIVSSEREKNSARWELTGDSGVKFGLVSRKKTDAVYLELRNFDSRLNFDHVARKGRYFDIATRAAAISATQILVHKAAIELDVSAEEFEAIEPRLRNGKPMLQIADALVNGSGLCRRLGAPSVPGGSPYIGELVVRILSCKDEWPLADLTAKYQHGSGHSAQCKTACYRCIQRFGNRRYHGLLDWRLGISYLRALVDPGYSCGLDRREETLPEISGWRDRALELAEDIAAMRPSILTSISLPYSGLPCIIENSRGNSPIYMVVVHPLWRKDAETLATILGPDYAPEMIAVDTFNLERRPLRELAKLRHTRT